MPPALLHTRAIRDCSLQPVVSCTHSSIRPEIFQARPENALLVQVLTRSSRLDCMPMFGHGAAFLPMTDPKRIQFALIETAWHDYDGSSDETYGRVR
jgi:hypothetical protein